MWKKTTGWLFEVQKRNGILEEKDRRLYEYAYGVLLGRVAIYLITRSESTRLNSSHDRQSRMPSSA